MPQSSEVAYVTMYNDSVWYSMHTIAERGGEGAKRAV